MSQRIASRHFQPCIQTLLKRLTPAQHQALLQFRTQLLEHKKS